jgi:hypothetical protein
MDVLDKIHDRSLRRQRLEEPHGGLVEAFVRLDRMDTACDIEPDREAEDLVSAEAALRVRR